MRNLITPRVPSRASTDRIISISLAAFLAAPVFAAVLSSSCASGRFFGDAKRADNARLPVRLEGPRLSILAYNVENLFDLTHDEGKLDQTFLPARLKEKGAFREACLAQNSSSRRKECLETNWDERALEQKLTNLTDAIQSVTQDRRGPDLLLLSEVENAHALQMLKERLRGSEYITQVLLEGRDERGIDPALLSRLPLIEPPRLHEIPFRAEDGEIPTGPSRGILQARLKLPDSTPLNAFVVHLPSQANPHIMRRQAVAALMSIVAQIPTNESVVVGGDFNITRLEDERTGLFNQTLKAVFDVSHIVGCTGCLGTHYFHPQREWSFLDAIMVRRDDTSGWRLDPASVRVPTSGQQQINKWGSPARYDAQTGKGVSDHFPVYTELVNVKGTAKSGG